MPPILFPYRFSQKTARCSIRVLRLCVPCVISRHRHLLEEKQLDTKYILPCLNTISRPSMSTGSSNSTCTMCGPSSRIFRLAQWSREERQPPIPKSPFTGQLHGHLEKLFGGCRLSMSWCRGTPLPCVFILQYAVSECRLVQRRHRETRDKRTASPTPQVTVSNVDHFRRNNINPHISFIHMEPDKL